MNLDTDTPQAGYVSADKGKTAALTVFCDSVAGRIANATDIWGGTYSYLDETPAKWFSNIKHDFALTSNIGYITSITVGDKTMKGNTFRENVTKNKIKSPCCTVTYSAS